MDISFEINPRSAELLGGESTAISYGVDIFASLIRGGIASVENVFSAQEWRFLSACAEDVVFSPWSSPVHTLTEMANTGAEYDGRDVEHDVELGKVTEKIAQLSDVQAWAVVLVVRFSREAVSEKKRRHDEWWTVAYRRKVLKASLQKSAPRSSSQRQPAVRKSMARMPASESPVAGG